MIELPAASPCAVDPVAGADDLFGNAPHAHAARELMQAMTGPAARGMDPAFPASAQTTIVCEFAGFNPAGVASVVLPGRTEPVPARSVVALSRRLVGRPVLVVHESSGVGAPIIVGVLRDADGGDNTAPPPENGSPFELEVDGERVVLNARNQLVLRCGQASITLTREGKILLRGTYVSSQSSGMHRINGASVDIN